MSRFATSKFKNAAANIAKKDQWFSDLKIGSPTSCGNHIQASGALMVFNTAQTGGGSLGVIPLDRCGRGLGSLPLLHAHGSLVTDMDFSPFDDYRLATCSSDCLIKLWDLPEGGLSESLSTPLVSFPRQAKAVQNVLFHPTAEGLLASSCDRTLQIWDVSKAQECIGPTLGLEVHGDQIQGISWKDDGSLLSTTSKDKKLRILDPRQNAVCSEADGFSNNKDSRVCWLADSDFILSTGFDKGRGREIWVWDQRQFSSPVTRQSVDQSTGTLMPFYDPDTKMLFLAGVGDTTLRYYEVTTSAPYVTERSAQQLPEQIKGLATVPKRALNVMACEVARLLLLTATSVVPIPYIVPRRSHRDFFEDLFPETNGEVAALTAEEWLGGANKEVAKMSLDPAKRQPLKKKTASGLPAGSGEPVLPTKPASSQPPAASVAQPKPALAQTPSPQGTADITTKMAAASIQSQKPVQEKSVVQGAGESQANEPPKAAKPKFTAPTTSKFRHMNSALMPRALHLYNLHNLSNNLFGECDVFHVNPKWGAVPLGGPGGMIGFVDLSQPGKLPRDLPAIQNGTGMADFALDPFDNSRLAVGCDNAKIFVWDLPSEAWTEPLTKPSLTLWGHNEKLYFVKFHPQAKNILMSASYDMTVKIWDLDSGEEKITLKGHTDQIFSGAWSSDGRRIATVCKDGKIRIFDPRTSPEPVQEGEGPPGSRGARVLWVCGDDFLLTTGFDRRADRAVSLYSLRDLSQPLETVTLDQSPATLVPYYDEDTNIVIVTGKGDMSAQAFEILTEPPYFLSVAPFQQMVPHQALSFLPKSMCNVRDVEFAKALRLTQTTIEPVTFSVPRIKKEYFQDDIFPETRVRWESVLTSQEWLAGKDGVQRRVSLCPSGMKLLSSIPKSVPVPKKYVAEVELSYKTDEQKKDELVSAITNKLEARNEPLPQDLCEGVDEDEWSD